MTIPDPSTPIGGGSPMGDFGGHDRIPEVEPPKYVRMITEFPLSTPIEEIWEALKIEGVGLVAVRTFGDLLVEVERGNVTDSAVLKVLGVKKPTKEKDASSTP